MKIIKLIILYLCVNTASSQIEYNIGIGGIANTIDGYGEFGYLAALNGNFKLSDKHLLELELQYQQTYYTTWVYRFDLITQPGPQEIRTNFAVDKTRRALTSFTYLYQPNDILRLGVGMQGGVKLAQEVGILRNSNVIIPQNSIMSSKYVCGALLKLRLNLKSFFVEVRYIHTINKSRAVYRISDNDMVFLEEIRTRPIQLIIGYTLN